VPRLPRPPRLLSDPRVAVLRAAYDAFNRRDVEAVLALLAPDVEWPNVLEQTVLRGREAVREYWLRQFREIDPRVEPLRFVAEGERLVAEVRQIVRDPGGRVLSERTVAHVYTFNGPLIATMRVAPAPAGG
jgi:ketosteroid isomerase-like protein